MSQAQIHCSKAGGDEAQGCSQAEAGGTARDPQLPGRLGGVANRDGGEDGRKGLALKYKDALPSLILLFFFFLSIQVLGS